MKPIAVLVSGTFRSYTKGLGPFLDKLPDIFHIFLSFPKSSEDQYLNPSIPLKELLANPRIKSIQFLEDPEFHLSRPLSSREKNTFLQWYRIQNTFQDISEEYEHIIRLRPDILFSCNTDFFVQYVTSEVTKHTILIPHGFDIFHSSFLQSKSINDQVAIGSYNTMKIYCNMYSYLLLEEPNHSCIVSEELLYHYLKLHNIHIQRIDIPYTLLLSQCFTISICGDSASGKSSLANLIQQTLPFDKTLLFETDRYHKWERGAQEYQQFTHLHPEANHLEKLSTDAYSLRLGNDVFQVNYDHSTGRFTEPQCVSAKHFTVFCGLHTLYLDSLRDIMDLKIYMDTDANLKEYWKVQRDTRHRGASAEQVRKTIANRQSDFAQFIQPQKENANIWIRFSSKNSSDDSCLELTIGIQKSLINDEIIDKLKIVCLELIDSSNVWYFRCNPFIKGDILTRIARDEGYTLSCLKDSFDGILQYLLILLTWKQS